MSAGLKKSLNSKCLFSFSGEDFTLGYDPRQWPQWCSALVLKISRVPGALAACFSTRCIFHCWSTGLVYEWYTVVGFIRSECICILRKKATGGLENQSFWFPHSSPPADCEMARDLIHDNICRSGFFLDFFTRKLKFFKPFGSIWK